MPGGGTESGISCFASGTLILTDKGAVPVERLAVGDLIRTVEGGTEPVIWIGTRVIDCRRHPRPTQVRPVRIRAHSIAADQPGRDLFLSPDHAVFAEGVLIPVKHLIDGDGIRQIDAGQITYVHIELPRHAVVLAEGLPGRELPRHRRSGCLRHGRSRSDAAPGLRVPNAPMSRCISRRPAMRRSG